MNGESGLIQIIPIRTGFGWEFTRKTRTLYPWVMMRPLMMRFAMVGSMAKEKVTMSFLFCRSSHLGEPTAFGPRRTLKMWPDLKKKAESCQKVSMKSKKPKKMEDGKLHTTHRRTWLCQRTSSRQSNRTKKLLNFTAHWVGAVSSSSVCNCNPPKNLKQGKIDSTNFLACCKKAKNLCDFLFKNISIISY